ncbi:MAG: phosphodiesterase [Jiangellaceae bacterium]|nr:phosphodiesterase [Jiangellaceae bacterium]
MPDTGTHEGLRLAIQEAGYYPNLVADTLETALAGEPVQSYVVHHEPHFDRDELRRHVSVLVLTPTRLIVGHTDEYPSDESHPLPYATTSTEAVPLDRVSSVVVSRTVTSPATYRTGEPAREVVLTVGWGAMSRVDLEPAGCGDPDCEADHGYTGTLSSDDFSLRVSEAADGGGRVQDMLDFARTLSAATVRVR